MRMLRTVPVLAVLVSSGYAMPSEEIPLAAWPSPLLWQPAAAVRPDEADPAAASGRQALALPSAPLPFVAITPCRQFDSRSSSPLTDNTPRTVTLTGTPCSIPATAQAAAVNITVFNITGAGSNGVFKVGTVSPPTTAWINYPPTETQRANAGVVALTAAGEIVVQVNQGAGSVAFVVDVNGYYAPQGIVNSVNTLSGDVTLSPGSNVSITPSGNTLTIAATAGGGSPSGPAGGSLSGTYPNPGIASGAVGPTQLANSTAVRSINGAAQDLVTLQGSGVVTVGTAGGTITVGALAASMVLGAPGDTTLVGAGYTEIAPSVVDYWAPTATADAPVARYGHSTVWTGSRMIVWGGFGGGGARNDGGQYDPVANAWTPTQTSGAPSARYRQVAVWTGALMIIWGGYTSNDGFRYDPVGDTWTPTAMPAFSIGTDLHTAVWTGSTMIVWGGFTNAGGIYDPAGDTWTATDTTSAPSARYSHSAVWTGSRMIVWGGWAGSTDLNSGGLYDPVGNTWTATSLTNAPVARGRHTAVWTGSRMVVWGGFNITLRLLNSGGLYDPEADAWTATPIYGTLEGRQYHSAVWTGSRMIIWGGENETNWFFYDGSQYDPAGNTWRPTVIGGAPSGRSYHSAVWTGSRMLIWGGSYGVGQLKSGAQWVSASLYMKN